MQTFESARQETIALQGDTHRHGSITDHETAFSMQSSSSGRSKTTQSDVKVCNRCNGKMHVAGKCQMNPESAIYVTRRDILQKPAEVRSKAISRTGAEQRVPRIQSTRSKPRYKWKKRNYVHFIVWKVRTQSKST